MAGWRFTSAALLLATSFARTSPAQSVTVRGVVYDSLHSRPLAGATVSAIGSASSAVTDSAGRFTFDIAPGKHRIVAQHDVIDAIGITAVGSWFDIDSARNNVRLAVPSFAQLWRLECGAKLPGSDTGFVFGTVRRAAGVRPAKIVVAVAWIDLASNGRSVSQKQKTLEVDADPSGNFSLCGVPTGTNLSIRATTDSAESGTFALPPLDNQRVTRRDLRLVNLAASVSKVGGAIVSGHVFADSGRGPIAGAEVSLVGVGFLDTTDDNGAYRFAGVIPGTHTVHVRRIGYGEVESRVDLEEGDTREVDLVLSRITMLDSMKVVGKTLARDEAMRVFDEHRKIGLGKFLTLEDLDKEKGRPLHSILQQFNGLIVTRRADGTYRLESTRGAKSLSPGRGCVTAVYIDGIKQDVRRSDGFDIREWPPEKLAGVEFYAGPGQTPAEYNELGNNCGVLVLHSRYKTSPKKP